MFRFAIGALVIAAIAPPAHARDACTLVKKDTRPGLHKVVDCGQKRKKCLTPHSEDTEYKRNESLQFAYVFPMKSERRSVAVVKVVKSGMLNNAGSAKSTVHLRRDGLDFACTRYGGDGTARREAMGDNTFVSFKTYGDFHRYFINNRESREKLENEFHVFYHNGQQCVRTDDRKRRLFFLLENDSRGYSPHGGFLTKLLSASSAVASQTPQPETAEVAIRTYIRNVNERGCINIRQKLDARSFALTIVDLESSVGDRGLASSSVYRKYKIDLKTD